jgi:phosphomannomutase/phosphoglucomutase
MFNFNLNIFRAYDIRGKYPQEINEKVAFFLARAFLKFLKKRGGKRLIIGLGRDGRTSSLPLFKNFLKGLLSEDVLVFDFGLCTSPMLYWAANFYSLDGAVQITASHLGKEYNGFKICNGYDTIAGDEIQKIRKIMEEGNFVSGRGTCQEYDILTPYKDFVVNNIKMGPKKLRIAIDAGNATGGPVALPILQRLGCEVHPLYCEMDGTFPNHEPDPTVMENLKDIIELVKRENLDVGIAYDGDCDRLGVVDHNGNVIFGDRLMLIFAREILSRKKGAVFVAEVKCSKVLFDEIEKLGGKAIMWKTGHSLIKAKMKEVGADLAGEMSGHMFFKDRYFGFDDGIYASCRLVEILSNTGKTIPELLEGLPEVYSTPEIRVPCPDEIKFAVVEKAREILRDKGYKVIDVDGARVVFQDGWGLVRASNTQPVLVVRYEAETPGRLEEIRNIVEEAIEKAKSELGS